MIQKTSFRRVAFFLRNETDAFLEALVLNRRNQSVKRNMHELLFFYLKHRSVVKLMVIHLHRNRWADARIANQMESSCLVMIKGRQQARHRSWK